MSDYAHEQTDALLSEMESKVFGVYSEAVEELKERFLKAMEEFKKNDEVLNKKYKAGELSGRDYAAWRRENILRNKHFKDMLEVLSEDMVNADRIAMSVISDQLPEVYALNANYSTYQIEKGTNLNTSWTLYDRDTVEELLRGDKNILPIPEVDIDVDKRWNKQHINNAITQGILQGDSIPDIASRLERVTGMGYNAAVRNARTATTAAENRGRITSYEHAKARGIQLEQEWQSAWDNKVRHEHRLLDGQRVAVGKKFEVDGAKIAFPGDPEAPGYLIYNCRCTLVPILKGYDHDSKQGFSYGDMSYEEWKHELQVNVSQSEATGGAKDSLESRIIDKNVLHIYKEAEAEAHWEITENKCEYVWGTNTIRITKDSTAADKIHELGHYLDCNGRYTMHEHRDATAIRTERDFYTGVKSISEYLKTVRMNAPWYNNEREFVLNWCKGITVTDDPIIGFATTLVKFRKNNNDTDLDCFSDIISALTDSEATGTLLTGHPSEYWKQYDNDFNAFPIRETECFTNYCGLRNHNAVFLIEELKKLAPTHVKYWENAYQVMIGNQKYLEV